MPFGDTLITVTGNLTADPELRYTPAGVAVAAFTVAASRRVYNQDTGQWADSDTLFLRCSAWRHLAEHIAESMVKGSRAVVTGRLRQRDYETTEGEKRTVYEVDVDDAGPSLRFATAKVVKATREHPPHPADGDRWAGPGTGHPPGPAEPAGTGAGAGDEPPF
jgi:single-strand DNA-binding protein